MSHSNRGLSSVLNTVVAHLGIPRSYYDKAAARHRSVGEWLCREGSQLAVFDPLVRPQGSFRYGTVVAPLNKTDEYDLDNVCVLQKLTTGAVTQSDLKRLYGEELRAYARAHQMVQPLEEHNRCWRLRYADEVNFHLDSLPSVPEDETATRFLAGSGVPEQLAKRAIAITDRKHPEYSTISLRWPRSNPRGFAHWFESRAALGRAAGDVDKSSRAAVEDVPSYDWKTTLQLGIQFFKRHRDVMFVDLPEVAPISMIITNLAAHAYGGELDLTAALLNIVDKMPQFVRTNRPRVPNPAYPVEDYADKWARDPRLEQHFWLWHEAVRSDIAKLDAATRDGTVGRVARQILRVELTPDEVRSFAAPPSDGAATASRSAGPLIITGAAKPWGTDEPVTA